MSSGDDHDNFNYNVCGAMVLTGFATLALKSDPSVLYASLGFGLGTYYVLSPDLDLKHSNPSKRLGIFRILFAPYRKLSGKHRSTISHSPILSNAIRVAYCLIPVIALCFYKGWESQLFALLMGKSARAVYVGLELSTITHLILDWQYSFRKKIKHF